jgi:hypothetical protein
MMHYLLPTAPPPLALIIPKPNNLKRHARLQFYFRRWNLAIIAHQANQSRPIGGAIAQCRGLDLLPWAQRG